MAIIVKTQNPGDLLSKIIKDINTGNIDAWYFVSDLGFSVTSEKWRNKAWLSVFDENPGKLTFGIHGNRQKDISISVYATYHSQFAEMLLFHFDAEFDEIVITAMPADFDSVKRNH